MFHRCESEEECKKLFRKLAFRLHPDCGGDSDLMVLLQESYELSLEIHQRNQQSKKTRKEDSDKESYQKHSDRIKYPDERLYIFSCLDSVEIVSDYHKDFYNSVLEFFKRTGYITMRQYEVLFRILKQYGNFEEEEESTQYR